MQRLYSNLQQCKENTKVSLIYSNCIPMKEYLMYFKKIAFGILIDFNTSAQ